MMHTRFRIKICGLKSVAETEHALASGADAIGFNFYRGSRRFVPQETAAACCRMVADRAFTVGVFVNDPPEAVTAVCEAVGCHAIQLHGDESLATFAPPIQGKRWHVIRALRLDATDEAIAQRAKSLADEWHAAGCTILLDAVPPANAPQAYGGTGQTLPWEKLRGSIQHPWILAGGLRPDNVAEAIQRAHPAGVDVASGVEGADGTKSPEKIRQFVAAARQAFASQGVQLS